MLGAALLLLIGGCTDAARETGSDSPPDPAVPDWAADAVFYQIFPERFANGDPANDPTRESLEYVENAPADWAAGHVGSPSRPIAAARSV